MFVLLFCAAVGAFGLAIALGFRRTALAVVFVRPLCDPIFDRAKEQLAAGIGPGAAINALLCAMAAALLLANPGVVLPLAAMWGTFLASCLVSALRAPDPVGGLRIFVVLCSYAAAFAIPIAFSTTPVRALTCIRVALLACVIPALVAVGEVLLNLAEDGRIKSTFSHPNIFAFFLLCAVALAAFVWKSSTSALRGIEKFSLAGFLPLLLVLLALTKTRSAWAALACMGLVFATAFDRRYLMGILVLPIVAFVPGIAERLGDLGNGAEFQYNSFDQLNSYAWRMYLWENAIMWLRAHPAGLLGHGLESFRTYSSVFFPLALEGGAPAHNAYLQIYFETGALGLTGFAVLFAALVRQLIRGTVRDRQGAGIALALVAGYLVVCYSDNVLDYLAFNWQFWFTLGSMLGVLRIQGPNPRARAVGVGRSELANAPGVGTLA